MSEQLPKKEKGNRLLEALGAGAGVTIPDLLRGLVGKGERRSSATGKRSLAGRRARQLLGYEQEPTEPAVTPLFNLKINNETRAAWLETFTEDRRIDSSQFYMVPKGEVVIVTRPIEDGVSYVFRTMTDNNGMPSWRCERVTPKLGANNEGFVATPMQNPIDSVFGMAMDAQSKAEGYYPLVTLSRYTEVLVTTAEIADIQQAVENSMDNPEAISAQRRYQAIVDAVVRQDR